MNRSAPHGQTGAIGVKPLFERGLARARTVSARVRRALGGALLAVAVPALLPLATTGCATVPETGRRQFVALSADTERSLGEAAFEEMLSGAKVVTSGPEFARVQRVGQRIAEASVRRYPDACAEFAWQFALIDTPEVNAWMLPGGKSGVNTGLLTVATTDDELAVVMGHEAAHAIARHGAERISRGMAVQVVFGVAAASGEVDPALVEATAVAYGALGETAFSRGEEGEADHIGLLIAADAGYDPRAAVEFWRKMGALGGAKPPEFLSTHPSDETRATRLAQLMPQALEVHRRAKEAGR
jgi:metalloendopeptidase OMA1, mitochondrial